MARDFDTSKFSRAVGVELGRMKLSARTEVRETGEEAARLAQQLAPRDSGAMAASIQADHGADRQGPYSDVTVGPWYSSFQEFGTSGTPARPFVRPATAAAVRQHLRKA